MAADLASTTHDGVCAVARIEVADFAVREFYADRTQVSFAPADDFSGPLFFAL